MVITDSAVSKEWKAQEYHSYSQIQYELAQALLRKCRFRGNEKVLDIGCGDGKISAEIAHKLPQGSVLGIDNSVSMIEFVGKSFGESALQNITFKLQDAAALSYDQEFDVVFAFNCLHWVADQQKALKGIYASLKPTGLFYAVFPLMNFEPSILKTIEKKNWSSYFEGYISPARSYGPAEYLVLLDNAHFVNKSVQQREAIMIFDNRETFFKWLKQILPHPQKLPKDQQDVFLEEIIDTLLEEAYPEALQSSDAVHMPLPVIEVQAQRE